MERINSKGYFLDGIWSLVGGCLLAGVEAGPQHSISRFSLVNGQPG